MTRRNKTIIRLLIISALALIVTGGCMTIWTDDVFISTLFKTVDANNLSVIAEPNYLEIISGESQTENDKLKVTTIYGVGETK